MTFAHPQLLSSLQQAGFFPASCDIQAQTAGVDAYGVPNGAWAAVAGLTGLPCSVHASPYMGGALSRQESKWPDRTVTIGIRRVVFAGRHPQITTKHRALIGGVAYDITAVDPDAYEVFTELLVQEVST